jgi:hypothetical protein
MDNINGMIRNGDKQMSDVRKLLKFNNIDEISDGISLSNIDAAKPLTPSEVHPET